MTLVIHNSEQMVAENHNCVFVDNFGKGLVLPIVIKPQTAK